MPPVTGDALEEEGRLVITGLGLKCLAGRRQARFVDLDPTGTYSASDHIEIDYLIPNGSYCAVGEITSRANTSGAESKHRRFIRGFNTLEGIAARLPTYTVAQREQFWRELGVPATDLIHFRRVRALRGAFICTELEKYDVRFDDVDRVASFFAADWRRLKGYKTAIGQYGSPLLLHTLDIEPEPTAQSITLSAATGHKLSRISDRRITGGGGPRCDIYTFDVSPYDILPAARVFRADQLPFLGSGEQRNYQRPLDAAKLADIRTKLLRDPDFVFPGNILVILSPDAQCGEDQLIVPKRYGSFSVVDGQHRLFSYADPDLAALQREQARISVMAVSFRTDDDDEVERESARTFIEVNTNQSTVSAAHLYAIKYPILGESDVIALTAQVLIRVNERRGALYGLLDTNQEVEGVIPPLTLLTSLRAYLRADRLRRVAEASRGVRQRRRRGYENALDVTDLYTLVGRDGTEANFNAEAFISAAVKGVGRYFDLIARVFPGDWPQRRGAPKHSSMRYAKFIAALIKLLQTFTDEGLNWSEIEAELRKIRRNVLRARNVKSTTRLVFSERSVAVPDAADRTTDILRFLEANRRAKTSISRITRAR
jgi:hypothetical protein